MDLPCGSRTWNYGVAVCDGKPGADDIEKLYQRWLQLRGVIQ